MKKHNTYLAESNYKYSLKPIILGFWLTLEIYKEKKNDLLSKSKISTFTLYYPFTWDFRLADISFNVLSFNSYVPSQYYKQTGEHGLDFGLVW